MRLSARLAAAALALSCSLLGAGAASAVTVNALSPDDAAAYTQAFQAAALGDFTTAEKMAADASDQSLVGYIEYRELMWPTTRAAYPDLVAWLAKYSDLPGADRVYRLALQRKPKGAPAPKAPPVPADPAGAAAAETAARGQAAREAYYAGDARIAHKLAVASGERWIAGLAAFRLKDFKEAMSRFQAVAMDGNENDWLRAGAAYWAARSAIAAGEPDKAPDFLRIASRSPATFYGMLAEKELGLEPGADPDAFVLAQAGFAPAPPSPDGDIVKAAHLALGGSQLARLIKTNARARRAVALAQIDLDVESGLELRAGLTSAKTDAERRLWTTLALELNPDALGGKTRSGRFDLEDYPTPPLDPVGGFTVDKALVYAMTRQESRFDPYATSPAGAVGLMQLMPRTAAAAAGDDKLSADPTPLYDPSFNLRVGQDYLDALLTRVTGGNLLQAIAAYNGGYRAVKRTLQIVGDKDPLMLIESLPAAETRGYVEKVMAGYWIYRRMFGEKASSLDALAAGGAILQAKLDR